MTGVQTCALPIFYRIIVEAYPESRHAAAAREIVFGRAVIAGDVRPAASDSAAAGQSAAEAYRIAERFYPQGDPQSRQDLTRAVELYREVAERFPDEPLAIERAVVPAVLLPSPDQIGDSLYAALAKMGNRPGRGLQRLQASLATPAEAERLSIPAGAAILRIERRTFLANGTPVEFTRSAYRGDRYDFVTEVREPGMSASIASGK